MKKASAALAFAILLNPAVLQAQNSDGPSLRFNGFGTAGVVYSDEDQADFISSLLAPDGAGYTRSLSPEVDSRLGLQLTADLSPRLTGVVQVIAEQRYDDTYTPILEWANLKYDITPDLNVRAGRVVLPIFMVSEYRKVGYAIPWVRPPQEVYRLLPVSSNDGVELSYRIRVDGFTNTFRFNFGRKDTKTDFAGETEARQGYTLSDMLEYGAATIHASYSSVHLTIDDFNPLFDAFRQFGPEGDAIADRYDIDDKRLEVVAVGARYDPGNWFVMGEWARTESRTFIGRNTGWYVTGGYHLGSITPYASWADLAIDSNTSDPGLSLAGLPPPAAAQAAGLNTALNQILGSGAQQKSLALGVRWDFRRNAALKVQYDHIDLGAGSPGVLMNTQPGFQPGGTVNLFSIAVDFVF